MIIINQIDNEKFEVYIKSDQESKHIVIFEDQYYSKFNKNKSKREIIKKSFEFLLKREPNTEILKKFNLKVINNYFPEYGNEFDLK